MRSLPANADIAQETAEQAGFALAVHRRFVQLSIVREETVKYRRMINTHFAR
jgi:hypothetical protein